MNVMKIINFNIPGFKYKGRSSIERNWVFINNPGSKLPPRFPCLYLFTRHAKDGLDSQALVSKQGNIHCIPIDFVYARLNKVLNKL